MTREKFEPTKKFFDINNNHMINPIDKLYKIRAYLSRSIYLWKKFYMPNKSLFIDEKMIAWKIRTKQKHYVPDKPIKFGFKVFVLSNLTSNYICNIDMYTSKNDTPTKNLGIKKNYIRFS